MSLRGALAEDIDDMPELRLTAPETCGGNNADSTLLYPYGYLNATDAAAFDEELMNPDTFAFTLEQLMELAGLAVAQAVYQIVQEEPQRQNILVICGPGNNGGDGLVAARHLQMFLGSVEADTRPTQKVVVWYPKPGGHPHYERLVQQCRDVNVEVILPIDESYPPAGGDMELFLSEYNIIVDAMFGFSFKGKPRAPFDSILSNLTLLSTTEGTAALPAIVVAVDIPSGWHVDNGDVHDLGYHPDVLVSLTAPKPCAEKFMCSDDTNSQRKDRRRHFIGGRFVPPALATRYNIRIPPYGGSSQVVEVQRIIPTPIDEKRRLPSCLGDEVSYDWQTDYAAYLAEEVQEGLSTRGRSEPSVSGGGRLTPGPDRLVHASCEDGKASAWETQYHAYLLEKEAQDDSVKSENDVSG
jgi:hydroxyethylthiazole kinase-like uncharacterized protein yjeF